MNNITQRAFTYTFGEVDNMFQVSARFEELGNEMWYVSVVLVTFAILMRVFAYWMRNSITATHQVEVRELLEMYDNVPEHVEEPADDLQVTREETKDGRSVVTERKPRRDNGHWWVWYSIAAREQFSNPSDTPVMRRSIHKWISEKMKEDCVTMKDRARVLGRAVEWTYVPNIGDVEGKKDARSRAVVERKVDYNRPWWSYWWGAPSTTAAD